MKKLLFILPAFCFLSCKTIYDANNPNRAPQKQFPDPFTFSMVDSIKDASKDVLYIRAHEWFAKTFVSAKEVIQMSDKEAGKLIGKGIVETPVRNGFGSITWHDYVHYTISVDVKNGKYRCVISDFYHEAGSYEGATNYGSLDNTSAPKQFGFSMDGKWKEIKTVSQDKANKILESLKISMKANSQDF